MKYEVVEAPELYKLEEMVNEMFGDGWKPQGGLCSTKYGTTTYYSQAMIKHDETILNAEEPIESYISRLMDDFEQNYV